jgi:hypothetical protein
VIGFMKQHIVQLSPINHLSALRTLVEVPFLRFAQLVKVSGVHGWDATSLAFASQGRSRCLYPFRASSLPIGCDKIMDNRCPAVFRELRSAISVERGKKWKHPPGWRQEGRASDQCAVNKTSRDSSSVGARRARSITSNNVTRRWLAWF